MPKKTKRDPSLDPFIEIELPPEVSSQQLFLSIYLDVPDNEWSNYATYFASNDCKMAATPDQADIVVIGGNGPLLSPECYKEKLSSDKDVQAFHKYGGWAPDTTRDRQDIDLIQECIAKGIPMLGINRGAILGAAISGLKIYQAVDGHFGVDHMVYVRPSYTPVFTPSNHLEGIDVPDSYDMAYEHMDILFTGWESRNRVSEEYSESSNGIQEDLEGFFNQEYCFLGCLPDPTIPGYPTYSKLVAELIESKIICNPNVQAASESNVYRLTKRNELCVV